MFEAPTEESPGRKKWVTGTEDGGVRIVIRWQNGKFDSDWTIRTVSAAGIGFAIYLAVINNG